LDAENHTIKIANGGHMSPIYTDELGAHFFGHDSKKGPPLGIIKDVSYEQETFDFEKNASITIFTDGVIEAKNSNSELYGIERLLKVIETQPVDPDKICKAVTRSVDKFTKTEGRSDDLTLLVVSRK